ncbi:hypothetical protein [uncultured Desulfobacter sp.]|uniref:hypothetical protein n=1 Tax=uncultured Desulfobacter sp. TaxID=240139 RepID=UPI002AA83124|nr:hypothetical protein [uncultured Desulfobacter sp.]
MESFAKYLLTSEKLKNRVFISNPPSAAILIWTNKDILPKITGVSIVEMEYTNYNSGVKIELVTDIFKKKLGTITPFKHIIYNKELAYFYINGERIGISDAANIISNDFNIKLGASPAKVPNDIKQIIDPFHIWSRNAFDGFSVMKTDIDILSLNDELSEIKSLVEIKRSKKIPVGKWRPFVNPNSRYNDCNNYYLMMELSDLLNANFFTIHHDIMDDNTLFNGPEQVDLFTYCPSPNKVKNQALLDDFASEKNRRIVEVQSFL